MKQKTKAEQKKQARQKIFKNIEKIESLIKSNPDISNSDELLFCVAETKRLAKSYAEVFRLAEVVCFCGVTKQKDTYFKNLLYSEIKKILDIDTSQQTF